MSDSEVKPSTNFIRHVINADNESQKHQGKVVTRFPPEPNGYLHIGHAKSICLNFGIADDYEDALCNLRFDDTNPEKESQEYIEAIKTDVQWLGYQWAGDIRYASSYFEYIYESAVSLIKSGDAYVCSLNSEQAREYRGTLTEPGKNSPDRERNIVENLSLLEKMKAGEFKDGDYSLRAKIDMSSPNITMRDPVLYRIRHIEHHQTGNNWCIYPMYDFTHCLSDANEGITHSLCTLEFEDHRPLYEWVLEKVATPARPQQIEFARLNLNYTITSKRKLKQLVDEKHVDGWDDPRLPTISGLRRRGYTSGSIRAFCDAIGVTRSEGIVDMAMLEFAIRDDLDKSAPRAMCVINPIKVVIENYPEDQVEELQMKRHPKDEAMGMRTVPFSREIYIDANDFLEEPVPKYFRLAPDKEVRLRGSYVIKCTSFIKNDAGEIIELRCTYDKDTLGKKPEGRKVKGVIHWVDAERSHPAQVNLYDRLFSQENPDKVEEGKTFLDCINPNSLTVKTTCRVESSLLEEQGNGRYQFEREGYFARDIESTSEKLIFNRTVTLRDSWGK